MIIINKINAIIMNLNFFSTSGISSYFNITMNNISVNMDKIFSDNSIYSYLQIDMLAQSIYSSILIIIILIILVRRPSY